MLTFVIALLLASAVVTFILMKKGKIADANNNNIPDAIEDKVEAIKEVVEKVEEIVKKVSKPKANKPKVEAPKPATKMDAPKPTINKKPVKKNK